jgi:hypothetical protein
MSYFFFFFFSFLISITVPLVTRNISTGNSFGELHAVPDVEIAVDLPNE